MRYAALIGCRLPCSLWRGGWERLGFFHCRARNSCSTGDTTTVTQLLTSFQVLANMLQTLEAHTRNSELNRQLDAVLRISRFIDRPHQKPLHQICRVDLMDGKLPESLVPHRLLSEVLPGAQGRVRVRGGAAVASHIATAVVRSTEGWDRSEKG